MPVACRESEGVEVPEACQETEGVEMPAAQPILDSSLDSMEHSLEVSPYINILALQIFLTISDAVRRPASTQGEGGTGKVGRK